MTRIFNSQNNTMAEVLDELANDAKTLPAGFSDAFRAGILWAVAELRTGVTNKTWSGLIVGECGLVQSEIVSCDCGCGAKSAKFTLPES